MRINRRTFLLAAAAAVACSRRDDSRGPRGAAQFLWSQQGEDGGFHSSTYGLLRSGQSLTPFVLAALLDVPETVFPPPLNGIERGLDFILKSTSAFTDDYPNYAIALAVTAVIKARRAGWQKNIEPMITQLRAQQFSEEQGWKQDDEPFGGWGMGGPIHRPPHAGHVDLSMTRYVMEALRAAGISSEDPAMTRALVYLRRSQNADGGFYFSPVNPEINKAGEDGGSFRSYGTATADGLLALRAAGVPESDSRLMEAISWLKIHHQPDRAPGFESESRQAWATGLRFYYASVISRTKLGLPVQLPEQNQDGSFRNSDNLVKEDDPLIATTFAIHALVSAKTQTG